MRILFVYYNTYYINNKVIYEISMKMLKDLYNMFPENIYFNSIKINCFITFIIYH